MKHSRIALFAISSVALALSAGCATTEQSRSIETPSVTAAARPYTGVKSPISIGNFQNRSDYLRGVFSSDSEDRLGNQAKTILTSHLQQSQRFRVLDRENLTAIRQEANFSKKNNAIAGARYVITGDVTAFGRKEVGDRQLFGILGRGKQQVAYAKVDLNVVDVVSSEVVFSAAGAGEYSLSDREVIGFGSRSGYDSTLNGKVLDLAIREAVDKLVAGIESGAWSPEK